MKKQKEEKWSEIQIQQRQRLMGADKPSRISMRVTTCVYDTAGGERKGEMRGDIVSSGMRGV